MRENTELTKEVLKQLILIEGKKQREVAKQFSCSEACVSKKMKLFGLTRKFEDKYIGNTYGKLTPIARVGKDKHGHMLLKCVCQCGEEYVGTAVNITNDNTSSCGCEAHKSGKDHYLFKGYEEIKMTYWCTVIRGARDRDIKMDLNIKDAWDLFIKQGRRCALTGQIIHFANTNKNLKIGTCSLDRIDSTKGYYLENVQWVHKTVNHMKWILSQEEFIEICTKVANYAT